MGLNMSEAHTRRKTYVEVLVKCIVEKGLQFGRRMEIEKHSVSRQKKPRFDRGTYYTAVFGLCAYWYLHSFVS